MNLKKKLFCTVLTGKIISKTCGGNMASLGVFPASLYDVVAS